MHINPDHFLENVRKFIGPRMADNIRNFLVDLCSISGLVPSATLSDKFEGISALVRVKNEEWWIEPSLLSIKDLVNEYVIIDSSTDNTAIIIEDIKEKWGLKINHIIDFEDNIVNLSNKGFKLTNYKWVLRWDGDFIAKEEMSSTIRELIGSLNVKRFYSIYWSNICLDGDLYHQNLVEPFEFEHWLSKYTPRSVFVQIPHGYEYMRIPFYYAKRLSIDKPLSFHLRTVKPPKRLLFRKYWYELFEKDLTSKITFEKYVQNRILEEYNTKNIEEASRIYFKDFLSKFTLHDKSKYGDYPKILKEYAMKRFNIVL
ncbi:MAG: glycosyltransferase [Nitrososphaeria archaeon]|jgi:hypothetical protein